MIEMLYKYCPSCFSLNVKLMSGSQYKCTCCNYEGEVKSDSIEKINNLKKEHKMTTNQKLLNSMNSSKPCGIIARANAKANGYRELHGNDQTPVKEKMESKFGKGGSDWELV